jgi:hypothetical protein
MGRSLLAALRLRLRAGTAPFDKDLRERVLQLICVSRFKQNVGRECTVQESNLQPAD